MDRVASIMGARLRPASVIVGGERSGERSSSGSVIALGVTPSEVRQNSQEVLLAVRGAQWIMARERSAVSKRLCGF